MKKYFLILCCLLLANYVCADFVEKNFEGMKVPVNEAVSHFDEWFETGDSEFVLFFDETDEIGMRDMDYQQYINGVKVENSALYVHSRNGFVTLINGDIMPISKLSQNSTKISPKRAIRIASGNDSVMYDAQKVIIHILNKNGKFEYYTTYKVITEYEEIYVDCSTGDTIQSLPLFQSSTSCQVTTKYNGNQNITCETNNNGNYILRNDSKNLRTLYGNYNPYNNNMPANRYVYENSSTNWSDHYLTSVVISAVHNESWWNPLVGDSNPDLYIRITDANGNLLYVSDYKEDCGTKTPFFVTFRITEMIKVPANGEIKIEVWDEDLGNDTKGSSVNLTSNIIGAYSWGNSTTNTEGYCVISQWHPALDVQWGLEKTWDFYYTEFNHIGFDGNNALTQAILHSPGDVDNIAAEVKHSIYNAKAMEPNNAFAHSDPNNVNTAFLYFGIGNEKGESLVDLNCVTHEFTHLVTSYRPKGKLVYQGESGAINEGYSDAMAVSAEARLTGNVNWLYGHGVQSLDIDGNVYDYCRNIADPKAGGPEGPKPDTYGGKNWTNPTDISNDNDYGGVHMNNSIFTHWYYILCEGKAGVNDNQHDYFVSPIGITKALSIIWRMHRTYLPPQATFAQARKYAIQSAEDLFPGDENTLKSVTDAWYAVGVGDQYVEPTEEFELKPGNYVIVANRDKDGDRNWYYMTSDLGTASTKRFQAVNTGTESIEAINITDLEDKYVWTLEKSGIEWKLKNGAKYVSWTSGNSATLATTARNLTLDAGNNQVQVHFNDGTSERYLSLNAAANNNYFAFYGNQNQVTKLFFIPCKESETPVTPVECKTVPYVETFASSQGDFTIENPELPSGFTSIWNWNSQYGMVANSTKNNTKYKSEAWLLSPCIELPENDKCVLTFSHAAKFFSSTEQMTLYLTTDYIKDAPGESEWHQLTISNYPTGTNWNWFESGEIDLSAYQGKEVVIAFRYVSDTNYAPQWEIKNFTVKQATTTAVSNTKAEESSATKILRNGQIFILRGNKTYTLQGQEVK